MSRYWMAVACQEHVATGAAEGFIQVCHGRSSPLKQMQAGDWIIYYSPGLKMNGPRHCRSFTGIAQILPKEPYPYAMSEVFRPWRRDVIFKKSKSLAIEGVLDSLSFIPDKAHWGYPFKRGCFAIPKSDFLLIAKGMGVDVGEG